MNITKTTLLILFISCFTWGNNLLGQTTTNRALEAEVSTSFVSAWETLSAVNDNVGSSSSTSKPAQGAYGNWNGEGDYGSYNWVQYEWETRIKIVSTSVYWWSDGGGILPPTDAYIEYWDGASWVNAGAIGKEVDMYNTLDLGVWSNMIRIYMKSSTSTGIIEWQVQATDETPCAASDITTLVKVNDGEAVAMSNIQVSIGDSIVIKTDIEGEGHLYWTGPGGFTATDIDSIKLKDLQPENSGRFNITYVNDCGGFSEKSINLTVRLNNDGSAYAWPSYSPTIYYDFRDEFPALEMPTQDLDDCSGVVKTVSSEWWTVKIGPNANHLVTDTAINAMLARLNKDFAYFRDTLGWPPDKRAKRGYRSAVYLYGSGLCTDNADSLAEGGWQGNINYNGENWPMVLLSYYPIACFDPYNSLSGKAFQTGAVVHEGIHSLLADLPGARNSAWFHEGGNTWLQQEMESRKSGNYSSMGHLNAGPLIAPFMPIECYSGWLQDESFGGPSAEGVNMFDGSQQICTWKNLLGGAQYANIFPVIFSQVFGDHSVAWLWRYCENRVLEGIADTLGDYQTRRVIMEYRAKQATIDMGKWTGACRTLIDANFGNPIQAEWQPYWINSPVWYATPYARTSDDGNGLLTPEYRTTPGWSGSNQIPIIVEGDQVTVEFLPIGENMSCQLCYRATDGSIVYGEPVLGGEVTLNLDKQPANDVVIAVICNTDYIYEGEKTRKAHFDYRLKLGDGVVERANWNQKWYQWNVNISNTAFPTSTVDFGANATITQVGTEIKFSDRSSNAVSGWLWDFGDGTTSTERSPSHAYSETGKYTVSLSVNGINGTLSKTRTDYITINPKVDIDNPEANMYIMVYPNPAKNICTVVIPEDLAGNAEIRVFNNIGKTLITESEVMNTQNVIDLSELSDGVYYLSVISNNVPVTKKLILIK